MSTIPPNFGKLVQACSEGDLPQVLALLPTTDPTWFKSAPLRTAADRNHTQIVLELLPHSQANANDHRALKCAIRHHNEVLFDALFPLCADCFTSDFYSVYATVYALWPEKLHVFEGMDISQEQYDLALMGSCHTTTDPKMVICLLDKTSVEAQKRAMATLLANCKYELFDELTDHSDPNNCTEAMVDCLPHDYPRAIKLFRRCLRNKVSLTSSEVYSVVEHALERLDWSTLSEARPLLTGRYMYLARKVAQHNDVDVYNYFEEIAPPDAVSAKISAQLGNKELTARQLNEDTVTPDVLHWISAWGWSDLLSQALECMSEWHLRDLQRGDTGLDDFDPNTWFAPCVRHQHYDCLGQVLSRAFIDTKRWSKVGRWVCALAGQFYSDPLFVDTLCKNVGAEEMSQIVKQAYENAIRCEENSQSYINIIEHLLPSVAQKYRVELFNSGVTMCATPQSNQCASIVANIVAPYIKNTDITPSTQPWWDVYQAQKLNGTLNEEVANTGREKRVKKI